MLSLGGAFSTSHGMRWLEEGPRGRNASFRNGVEWFRLFVEHLVCISKTKGCKTTLDGYPTPSKTKKHQHRDNSCVESHTQIAFQAQKWGKGKKTNKLWVEMWAKELGFMVEVQGMECGGVQWWVTVQRTGEGARWC
jgi:hypothetical protein